MAGTSMGGCTSATCPVEKGFLSAPPSLEGAAFMIAAFATLVPINLWIGTRCKTTLYTWTLIVGLLAEVMGYVGSLLLRSNLASKSYFILFLLGTTMGPTFITAAVYTILPHILALYGSDLSVVPEPIWLSYFFLFFDVFTLAFQAVGSVFAAKGFNKLEIKQGVNILVVGLALQVVSVLGFFGTYFWFMSRVVRSRNFLDPRFSGVYLSTRFRSAVLCVQLALAFILARTIARMVQLLSGLDSYLSQSQTYLLVLDGAFVLLGAMLLTLASPGPAFGRAWGSTSPSKKKAHRHLAVLHPVQRSPGSLLYMHGSPVPSPEGCQVGYGYGYAATANAKEPRSPPPSVTTDSNGAGAAAGSGYGFKDTVNDPGIVLGHTRRYSPRRAMYKRQAPAQAVDGAELPPYDRSMSNIARVPYIPPRDPSLSQQYGQGTIVESQIVALGTEGSRTGGTASGGSGGPGARTRTRNSPRMYDEDMVKPDAIW